MAYQRKRDPLPPCPVEFALEQVAGKWKVRVIDQLRTGPHRFAELRRALPGISQQVLATQLSGLQRDGLISAQTEADRSDRRQPRQLYQLSPVGQSLLPALDAVALWGGARLLSQTPGAQPYITPKLLR